MAKYSIVELLIDKGQLLGLNILSRQVQEALQLNNVIYIYRGSRSGKVYIGQTIHFITRHKQHYSGSDEKFNRADFDHVMIIFSVYFNRSALDDVESKLITCFIADKAEKAGWAVAYDNKNVINRTGGNSVNEYMGREKVASEVILPIWEKELYPRKWVQTKTLEEIRNKELVKYSPIKMLTAQQRELINEIVEYPRQNYIINGDAGTGKTVLLTHLVASLCKARPEITIGVVVQPNWEDTGAEIFKAYGISNQQLTIATSTKLIKKNQRYDVIIVDEAHKLSRKYGKQHPSFGDVYKIPEFENCESHLEILQRMGKQLILMYDVLQAIRPANVSRQRFQELTSGYEKRFLKTQFRIQTPEGKDYTSDDYINGIKYLLYKDTGLLDSKLTNFDPEFNREVFRDESQEAYFGYYMDEPLHHLVDWIEEDNNYHPEHINRVLAGLVEPWRQKDGKDKTKMHWHEGDLHRRWNSTQKEWLNSKDEDAAEQIGSVFAVQGNDLNKVGVLIGSDIEVGEDGKLRANPNKFYNTNGIFTADEMTYPDNKFEFTLFVMNIYYVLLTRGIDGIRLGFWKNDTFRRYMEQTLEIKRYDDNSEEEEAVNE